MDRPVLKPKINLEPYSTLTGDKLKVLLVEDDNLIGDGTKKLLANEGFSVDWVLCQADAISALTTHDYDVVVLDIQLPDGSGLNILKRIRQASDRVAVLFLTALNSTADRVRGLDLGADDYLIKPFEFSELCARIRAVHRRHQGLAQPQITVGDLVLDPAAHRLTQDGETIELGPKEFSILKILMERAGRVVTKSALEENLYSWGEEVASNAVEVLIHRIRKKLRDDPLRTIRGVGYMLEKGSKGD